MAGAKRYRVNKPNVVHEVLEGEAVIVNLVTGSYYSTEQSGATIWSLLDQGTTMPEIVAQLHRRHSGVPHGVDALVAEWLEFLEAESLVVGEPIADAATDGGATAVAADDGQGKTPFVEPKVEKYTDMEDLLLLDPIHDVQETGWPRASADPAG